ncbi:MAG: FtsX-like permease family protein [Chloroflexi bacterium]|nr:FtsX-like permease family protein [Chloroflexota bacterium]
MEKLFGVPIDRLMLSLLVVFAVGVAVMAVVAWRNQVVFKMAVRNIPRRRAQTILIVLGLMLATLLFSASFATGDTLTHSMRVEAVKHFGLVDVIVQGETRDVGNRLPSFDQTYAGRVQEALAGDSQVAGVAPLLQERAPVLAPGTRLSEPWVDILGYAPQSMAGFDRLLDVTGKEMALDALAPGKAYLSAELTEELDVHRGDTVQVFLGPQPTPLEVIGVYVKGASPAGERSLVVSLPYLQTVTGAQGAVNAVIISNRGGTLEGVRHTNAVVSALGPLLEGSGLKAEPVKQKALDRADREGGTFATVFLLFAQFSIAAGILLIFLIFVMLAAERKRELGIARAVGMQRGHVVRMFAFEGATYSLIAAGVGSLLGVVVGWGMVRIMAAAFSQWDFHLTFAFNWRSVVIAYTLGMVLTFAVVLSSSWRVSRLNIVRAIRDIPEPSTSRKSLKGVIFLGLLVAGGALLTVWGVQEEQLGLYLLGASLIIIGLPMLARRFGLRDRIAYTVAGVGLVAWWMAPESWHDAAFPFLPEEMKAGIEMFFLSGIMLVIGGVWTVIYNADLLLNALVFVFGRLRGLPPVLRTAVAYPMQYRFRTGMTLAMVSLVMFTLIVMAFIIQSISGVFADVDRIAGGFDIRANTSYTNPVPDLRVALTGAGGLRPDDYTAIGGITAVPVKVKQMGIEGEPVDLMVSGVDTGYTDAVGYKFAMMAPGYTSPRQVWQALQDEPGTAIVPTWMVPTKTNFNVGDAGPALRLEGFWREDKVLPEELYLEVQDPRTGRTKRLRVIGAVEDMAFYVGSITTSQSTVHGLLERAVPPQSYMLRLTDGVDAETAAKALKAAFLENGLQAQVIATEVRRDTSASLMINNLLMGFMGLGLVVGIAALGVIAARSVVERRQQIGVLRALGFQKGMVQFSFLLESSFVALLGIGIGVGLGFGISPQVINSFKESFEAITYQVPWGVVLFISGVAYAASLLTTFLPARQAASVYPAEALRFTE